MTTINYSYQPIAAEKVLENALNFNYLASVLAACPSSGKTTISHIIINKYLEIYPEARLLVLTEGQNTLKNQYLEELDDANVEINFTYGPIGSDTQVQVGLPQSINKLRGKVDMLIVDECHNYYGKPMEQRIIRELKPSHQVLMTGTPSPFNAYNEKHGLKKKYGMYYISADFLQKQGVFSAADLDVIKVTYKKNATQTMKETLSEAKKRGADLSKLMVACPNIAYAKDVAKYLLSQGKTVSLSTSENDNENKEIKRFKAGETNALVVVGKGVLGFNEKMMTCLFDLKSSTNVDSGYQLFARILRVHPQDIVKTYFRVAEKKNYVSQVGMLYKMIALMDEKVFKGFNGKNLRLEVL